MDPQPIYILNDNFKAKISGKVAYMYHHNSLKFTVKKDLPLICALKKNDVKCKKYHLNEIMCGKPLVIEILLLLLDNK